VELANQNIHKISGSKNEIRKVLIVDDDEISPAPSSDKELKRQYCENFLAGNGGRMPRQFYP